MGVIINAVLDKIFGKIGGDNPAISTVDKTTASRKSEIEAIKNAEQSQVLVSTISQKRKFKPTVAAVPGKDGVKSISKIQQFAVSANLSGGIKGGLTQQQVNDLKVRPFTEQELEDIKKLNARRNKSKDTGKFFLKQSGEEVVLAKREQEAIAKGTFAPGSFVNGKLFANPKFGAPSNDPNNLTSKERAEIRANQIKNAAIAKERNARGRRIQEKLDSSGTTQQQAVLAKGAVLRGGNRLNARALARLQEKGLI